MGETRSTQRRQQRKQPAGHQARRRDELKLRRERKALDELAEQVWLYLAAYPRGAHLQTYLEKLPHFPELNRRMIRRVDREMREEVAPF